MQRNTHNPKRPGNDKMDKISSNREWEDCLLCHHVFWLQSCSCSVLTCTLPQALPCRHLSTLIVPLLRSCVLYCIVSLYAWLERASPVPSLTRLRSPDWFKNIQDMIAALRRLRYVSVLLLKSRSCFALIFSCLNGSSIFQNMEQHL